MRVFFHIRQPDQKLLQKGNFYFFKNWHWFKFWREKFKIQNCITAWAWLTKMTKSRYDNSTLIRKIPSFSSHFTDAKGHFTLLQAYALQKGGYFSNDHVVFKGGLSKNHIHPHGGGGLKNQKNLTTWFKDGPWWWPRLLSDTHEFINTWFANKVGFWVRPADHIYKLILVSRAWTSWEGL